jgi:hypothetical protein
MNAARPTARASPALDKLVYSSPDSPCAGLFLFRIFYPADKFISRDGRQTFPKAGYLFGLGKCIGQVRGQLVDKTARNPFRHIF